MKPFKSEWDQWQPNTPQKQGAMSDKLEPGTCGTEFLRGVLPKIIAGITLLECDKDIGAENLKQALKRIRPGVTLRMWSDKLQDFLFVAASEDDRKILHEQFPRFGIYLQNEMSLLRGQGFSTENLVFMHEIKKTFNAVITEVKNTSGLGVQNSTGTGRKVDP